MAGFTATAQTQVDAERARVWSALTDPAQIAVYMEGALVETTWEVGSPITWSGDYQGRPYQDKGEVLAFDEPQLLSVSHYTPLLGQPDEPENYHVLIYVLTEHEGGTLLELTQDGCDDEAQAEQFSQNWQQMLDGLKAHVEG
jgi:uncharacterized protein YndB with AHSA1/START domain